MKLFQSLIVAAIRLPLIGNAIVALLSALKRQTIEIMKRARKNHVRPRNWSNAELRKFAPLYTGKAINVSGWKDEDQTGGHYRAYFSNADGYFVSNYQGDRGQQQREGEIFLDLTGDLPEELRGQFQAVFNHTTLEHVYDINKAVANICALSHDTVILVTPFLQQVHYEPGSYGDYWRPTPMCVEKMLQDNGFEVVYQSTNDNDWYIVYVFTVASKQPQNWRGRIPAGVSDKFTGCGLFGLDTDRR